MIFVKKNLLSRVMLASALCAVVSHTLYGKAQASPPTLDGGTQLGNVIDSASGPSLAILGNQLIVAYVDDNTKDLWVAQGSTPASINGGVNTGLQARDTPVAAVFNNILYIIYDDKSSGALKSIYSTNGINFSAPVTVNWAGTCIQPQLGLGLQAFNGYLYLSGLSEPACTGGGRVALSYGGTDGINFTATSGPSASASGGATVNYGASLALYNGGLVISTTDQDGNLIQSGAAGAIPGNGTRYKYTPYAAPYNGVLYTFGRNWADQHYIEEVNLTGSNIYSGYYDYSQRISSPPGVITFNGQIVVAGRSDSNDHLVVYVGN